jgi:hypothetical protein
MSFSAHTMKGKMAELGLVFTRTPKYKRKLILSADRNLKSRFLPEVQERYAEAWEKFDPTATISRERTIEGALHRAREIGDQSNGIQALITGSLHLVSGALCLLESDHLIQRLC